MSHYYDNRGAGGDREPPWVITGTIGYLHRHTIDNRVIDDIAVTKPVPIRDTADTILGAFYEVWVQDDGTIYARGGLTHDTESITGGMDLDESDTAILDPDGTLHVTGRLAGFTLYPRSDYTPAWQAIEIKVTPA